MCTFFAAAMLESLFFNSEKYENVAENENNRKIVEALTGEQNKPWGLNSWTLFCKFCNSLKGANYFAWLLY